MHGQGIGCLCVSFTVKAPGDTGQDNQKSGGPEWELIYQYYTC